MVYNLSAAEGACSAAVERRFLEQPRQVVGADGDHHDGIDHSACVQNSPQSADLDGMRDECAPERVLCVGWDGQAVDPGDVPAGASPADLSREDILVSDCSNQATDRWRDRVPDVCQSHAVYRTS